MIALLGWNPGDDREVMEIGEIIEAFDIKDIQKGAARFDEAKMAHINFQLRPMHGLLDPC